MLELTHSSILFSLELYVHGISYLYLLQCDATYRGHPTNIFTSKKLANQGTRI